MDDFIYDIRWQEDENEWRARARRELYTRFNLPVGVSLACVARKDYA